MMKRIIRPIGSLITPLLILTSSYAQSPVASPSPAQDYSITQGKFVPVPAKKTSMPLIIFGETKGQSSTYVASGLMGDADSLKILSYDQSAPVPSKPDASTAIKIQYSGKGKNGWAGVYWLTPANNWGKVKGAGYDLTAAKRLTFWARGAKGGERITQFKVGGLIGPYPDTDTAVLSNLKLTPGWEKYSIDLSGKDLRHIAGGFNFTMRRAENPFGATFFIDEIMFEGEGGIPLVTEAPAGKLSDLVKKIVPFASAKNIFSPETQPVMDEAVAIIGKYPDAKVTVEGFTDNVGPEDVNLRLSLERAKAVTDYLTGKGISPERIKLKGFGADSPIASNDSEEGRAKNNRVEILIAP